MQTTTKLNQDAEPSAIAPVRVQPVVRDSDPRYSHREISMAVMQCCTCGGGGPDDKHTCPACHVYHALATIPNAKLCGGLAEKPK